MSCPIYGRETVEYVYTLEDANSAEQLNTLDWTIEDTLLDTTDNTEIRLATDSTAVQDVIYESAGPKLVSTIVKFDNGWGDIYDHYAELEVEALVYEAPVLDMVWTPEEPTILDTIEFSQKHNDKRSLDNANVHGKISTSTIDYYNDGTIEETELETTDTTQYQFTSKEDGIQIKLVSTYWDGWEDQTEELIKTLNMANIPPVSDHEREDKGQCIPAYIWTAAGTDLDDDDELLTYQWWLSKKDGENWVQLSTGTEEEFTYPFQYEGDYKLVLRTTDTEGAYDDKTEEFPIVFGECNSSGGDGSSSGIVRLESNRFEMVSTPVRGRTVSDYFMAKVAEATGRPAEESIEFVKAYVSNDVSSGKYLGFVPGVTNPASTYNFKLVELDDGVEAHVPYFVKTKELAEPIIIEWSTEDEVVE